MNIGKNTNMMIRAIGLSMILFILVTYIKPDIERMLHYPRNVIMPLIFVLWLYTVNRRVIQKHIRRYLFAVAFFELLWLLIRIVKFDFLKELGSVRFAWYLYYIPMTMIPVFCLLLAVSMGKPDDYRPQSFLMVFPVISSLLSLLVVTNDLHSLVFIIPEGPDGLEVGNYSYGIGYFVTISYICLCYIASLGIIFTKCRVRGSRKIRIAPFISMIICILVCVVYCLGVRMDITFTICAFITVTLEMCIQSRMMLTNNGYDELFGMSGIHAVIAGNDLLPVIVSDPYENISPDEMKSAVSAPVRLRNGSILSCKKIKRGYVFWQEDLSELYAVLEELSSVNDCLRDKNTALTQAYEYSKKERQLIEKNRLYNRVLTKSKHEIELYSELVENLSEETDGEKKKSLAVKTAFVSAFIKRRDNLIFLSEEEKLIAPSELYYCIDESLSNLRLGGAECCCSYELETPLAFEKISHIYELFYKIIYQLIDSISSLYVYLIEDSGGTSLVMRILCDKELNPLVVSDENIIMEKEENEWTVTIR